MPPQPSSSLSHQLDHGLQCCSITATLTDGGSCNAFTPALQGTAASQSLHGCGPPAVTLGCLHLANSGDTAHSGTTLTVCPLNKSKPCCTVHIRIAVPAWTRPTRGHLQGRWAEHAQQSQVLPYSWGPTCGRPPRSRQPSLAHRLPPLSPANSSQPFSFLPTLSPALSIPLLSFPLYIFTLLSSAISLHPPGPYWPLPVPG